jgi:hypothetical protein
MTAITFANSFRTCIKILRLFKRKKAASSGQLQKPIINELLFHHMNILFLAFFKTTFQAFSFKDYFVDSFDIDKFD